MSAAVWVWLAGCSRAGESVGEPTPPDAFDDTAAYAAFCLTENDDAAETRNDVHKDYGDNYAEFEWFNHGTADERAVSADSRCNRVFFFVGNRYYGCSNLTPKGNNIFVGRQPKSALTTLPNRFVVVLNGDPARLDALRSSLIGNGSLGAALNWLQDIGADETNPESTAMYGEYFTMSSSIYRDEDSRNIAGVTQKDDFRFYETEEEALLPRNLLNFYVDRVAAKVTVRVQDGDLKFSDRLGNKPKPVILVAPNRLKVRNYYSADGLGEKDVMSTWSANLVTWGINGVEKNTYLFKTLVAQPDSSAWPEYPWLVDHDFYAYGQNTSIWNSPNLYRSYWAIDQNYYDGIYPDQYRVALDVDEGEVDSATSNTVYSDSYDAAKGLESKDYTLVYRSYNAFTARADHKYSVENTYDASVIGSVMNDNEYSARPWLRCGSHVIVTAQLIVDALDDVDSNNVDPERVDATGFISGISDKYFSNGLWWDRTALIQQAVATLKSNIYFNREESGIRNVLKSVTGGSDTVEFIENDPDRNPLDENTPLVVMENGTETALTYENATDYFEMAPAFIKGGDGWVTIRLKEGVDLRAKYRNGLQKISEEQLVSYIYRFTNLAKHYKEGRMYYALDIRHNVESRNFERGLEQVSTGDYGMVRNHWYRLTINQLLRPGTPVDDPDQPIIPNNEPNDKSLGVEVEIIPWHIVDIKVPNLQ